MTDSIPILATKRTAASTSDEREYDAVVQDEVDKVVVIRHFGEFFLPSGEVEPDDIRERCRRR